MRLRRLVAGLQRAFDAGAEAQRRRPRGPEAAAEDVSLAALELSFRAQVPADAASTWDSGGDLLLCVPPPPGLAAQLARRLRRGPGPAGRLVTVRVGADGPAQVTFDDPLNANQEGTDR